MRIPRTDESEGSIINMSSLLDVLFILIIFFLATATFREQERDIQVDLPHTGETASLSAAPKIITINVRKTGDYWVSSRVMNIGEVRRTVKEAVTKDPEQKVLVRGDKKAFHEYVAAAVRVCNEVGVERANIGYDVRPVK